MWNKLKDKFGKVNKKALGASIGLMLISWAALPIIYWLIVRKNTPTKEEKIEKDENMG